MEAMGPIYPGLTARTPEGGSEVEEEMQKEGEMRGRDWGCHSAFIVRRPV